MPPVPPLTMPNGRQASFIYGPNGEPIRHEHAGDGFALPHVIQFAAVYQGAQKTYFHDRWDEARKHSRENSLAMERDAFLQGLMQERKLATASLKWSIEVDDKNDPYEKALAEGMARIIKRTPHLLRHHYAALDAVWYGRHGVQHQNEWQEIDLPAVQFTPPGMGAPGVMTQRTAPRRCLVTKRHQPVHGDSIGHKHDGTPYVLMYSPEAYRIPGAEVTMTTGGSYGLVLRGGWRERFVIHSHESVSADFFESERGEAIHGCGVRDRIYWLDWLRREYLDWVVTYYERVGLGVNLWYYEAGNDASYQEVERLAREQTRRANIMIPFYGGKTGLGAGGMERVETPIAGAEALLGMVRHIEEQQERYIVGQSLSSGTEGSGLGGTGVAGLHAQTKQLIIKFDADNLSETYTQDWLRPTQFWSFPELRKCQARFKFSVPDPEAAAKLDAVTKVIAFGVTFKADEVRELTGMSTPEPGDETVPPMMAAAPGEGQPGEEMDPDDEEVTREDEPYGDEHDNFTRDIYDDDNRPVPQPGVEIDPRKLAEMAQYEREALPELYVEPDPQQPPQPQPQPQTPAPQQPPAPPTPERAMSARVHVRPLNEVPRWVPVRGPRGQVWHEHSTTGEVHRSDQPPAVSAEVVHQRAMDKLTRPPRTKVAKRDLAEVKAKLREMGINVPLKQLHTLVGAQPGLTIQVGPTYRGLGFHGTGPQIAPRLGMTADMYKDSSGRRVMHFGTLGLHDDFRTGNSLKGLRDMVQTLVNAGFHRIETTGGRSDYMTGYYHWPRLGFDADISRYVSHPTVPEQFRGVKTLQDLYALPGGPDAWKEFGDSIHVNFDLMPGSRSLGILGRWIKARRLDPIVHPPDYNVLSSATPTAAAFAQAYPQQPQQAAPATAAGPEPDWQPAPTPAAPPETRSPYDLGYAGEFPAYNSLSPEGAQRDAGQRDRMAYAPPGHSQPNSPWHQASPDERFRHWLATHGRDMSTHVPIPVRGSHAILADLLEHGLGEARHLESVAPVMRRIYDSWSQAARNQVDVRSGDFGEHLQGRMHEIFDPWRSDHDHLMAMFGHTQGAPPPLARQALAAANQTQAHGWRARMDHVPGEVLDAYRAARADPATFRQNARTARHLTGHVFNAGMSGGDILRHVDRLVDIIDHMPDPVQRALHVLSQPGGDPGRRTHAGAVVTNWYHSHAAANNLPTRLDDAPASHRIVDDLAHLWSRFGMEPVGRDPNYLPQPEAAAPGQQAPPAT